MTDQSDQANLNATGNAGNAPGASGNAAPQTQSDPNTGKTLDNAAGTMKPAASNQPAPKPAPTADAAKAAASTSSASLRDQRNPNHIDPSTGRPFGESARSQPDTAHVNQSLSTEAGKIAQHDLVDKQNDERNKANAEGHQKNMDAIERAHAEGAKRAEQHKAPPTGKQRDENTPRVNKDGSKTWTL